MRPTIPSNRRVVTMDWLGDGLKFRGRGSEPESPEVIIDGDSEQGPSPMLALLLAAGGALAVALRVRSPRGAAAGRRTD